MMQSGTTSIGRKSIPAWQDRFRDPSLTALLVIQICLMFVIAPLVAQGLPMAREVGEALLLVAALIVVLLSRSRAAIVIVLLGIAAAAARFLLPPELSRVSASLLTRGGGILAISALVWVVVYAVYAPGRITSQRIQGAFVLYLSIAELFTRAYCLIWELSPTAFANLPAPTGGPGDTATMSYFSLITLTTIGYGDIVPVNAFARSLTTLEAVIGQLFLVTTVARLVTLELESRRR
jgi:hypothetical protein